MPGLIPLSNVEIDDLGMNRSLSLTRDRVIALLGQNPHLRWTPQIIYEELRRLGPPVTAMLSTILQRLAAAGDVVQRVGPGAYQLVDPTSGSTTPEPAQDSVLFTLPFSSNGAEAGVEDWLTDDALERVAEEAVGRFLARHPETADRRTLVAEAKRRVAGWTERHHQQPYDEGHVRRLMKTALDDYRRGLGKRG